MEGYHEGKQAVVLIPSLEPDFGLVSYISKLQELGIKDIVIVDDGSGEAYQPIFDELVTQGCVVLHHTTNKGKGSALKTGFQYIKENYPHASCVVTADSDGQHAAKDVYRVLEYASQHPDSLTLGVRDFSSPGIPQKSLLGNRFASFIFAALYGKHLSDTQTGLRAFCLPLLDFMLRVGGARFEYEIQMLIACVRANIPLLTLPIQVIYENANEGTHFKPIRDSMRIVGTLLSNFILFSLSSLASGVIDIGLFWLFLDLLSLTPARDFVRILLATSMARVVSIGVNYLLNRFLVFREAQAGGRSLKLYLLLSLAIMLLSAMGVYGLQALLHIDEKVGKIICDCLLFVLSYWVQQRWIFKARRKCNE